MEIRFDNKVVIVTGASLGIGKATAIEFGKAGASVVVNYNRSKESALDVVETIKSAGGKAIAVQADVSRADQVKTLIEKTVAAFGSRIDILVNNAGSLLERRTIEDMTEDLWDECMEVNIKSVYLCTQAVMPYMKKQNYGRIINLTSIAGRNGGGVGASHYSSSKAAVLTLTKGMAKELIPYGIIVNAVAPGVINTPFHDKFSTKELRESFVKMIPVGREGEAEEIAWPILFLASDYATFIVGETLEVNGGQLMD
ncbi:MAG: 3-oxoacyl-ACP reductase FabG [Calditrichales bacterium]|nr:MAG: 3-oxoacyl-ACP reductase FabG [Calditrichales bacterium]